MSARGWRSEGRKNLGRPSFFRLRRDRSDLSTRRTVSIRGLTPLCPAGHLPLKGGIDPWLALRSRSCPIVLSKTPSTGDGARASRTVFIRGLPPSVLPDISPSRGEIDSWLALGSRSCPVVLSKTPSTGDSVRASAVLPISPTSTGRCPAGQRGVCGVRAIWASPELTSKGKAPDCMRMHGINPPHLAIADATLLA